MTSRRDFLRGLLGAAGVAVVPAPVVYCFAPPGGWSLTEGGLWATNSAGTSMWAAKSPTEILQDVNALLEEMARPWEFIPQNLLLGKAQLELLRRKRNEEWLL